LILHDPTDTYSVSLANAVANRVLGLGAKITQATFTEKTTTVDQYQQVVEQAIASNVDTIFMAGYSVDGIRLAHAVGNEARANPANSQLNQLKIVGGDTMLGGVLVGEGNNADANIARTFPQDIRRLVITSYADSNEWNLLGIPPVQQPAFFTEWKSTYQSSQVENNALNPTYEGLLGYDATKVILHATTYIQGQITGDAVRNALVSLGKGKVPAYQGISGRIIFNSKGDPIDKAVVVLAVQDNGNGNQIVVQQVVGTFR
jgi:ABC-type branched-subunit amino acid transport system substrate-binding protein